jgi:hypothetical protein
MNPAELASKLGSARREGREWRCRCPAHDDHDPSLSITERDGKLLVKCRAGCYQETVIDALRQRDLWPEPVNERSLIVATYGYRDEHGALRYQVVRLFPKKFYQRRPNGSDGSFVNNMNGITPLPYRLPELLADPEATVFIPEGEKDCDSLGELGFVATCNHMGAGKWRNEISRWLAGRHVVLLPDNDAPGRAHANDVAHKLAGIAASVRVLELPGLQPKGDVSNWIAAGGTQSDLEVLADATGPFRPRREASRFWLTPFAEIVLGNETTYTVDNLIPKLGVVVIWGKPKCGKTFWTFDLEMHVALGWPYRGHRVEQGVVLHIACEGVAGLAARKEAWRQHHVDRGYDAAELDAAPFYLCKETTLDLIKDVDELANAICEQFDSRPIKIITIDTLNRSLRGSESKDEDMTAYIRAAVTLAEKFQCAVLIVHHCGYDSTHPRGHTSLIGAVDADIEVTKEETGQVRTEVKNMRDGENGTPTHSSLVPIEVGRDVNGEPIVSCVIMPADGEDFPKKKTRPLSAAQGRALQLLAKAIEIAGLPAPPETANHIPPRSRCVTEDLWRDYCYQGAISAGDQDAKRMAFKRAAEALVAADRVGKWDPWVWIT